MPSEFHDVSKVAIICMLLVLYVVTDKDPTRHRFMALALLAVYFVVRVLQGLGIV